jgi:hypothetical protein
MGRPPIGKRRMTATERQRRWRAKRRLAQSAGPQSKRPPGDERAAAPERYQTQIEELTRQRDEAREELKRVRQTAYQAVHKAVGPDDPNPCSRCRHGQGGAIKVILKVPLPESDFQLFLCNECIESLRRSAAAEWLMRGDDE